MTSLKYFITQQAIKKMDAKSLFKLSGDEFKQNILQNYRNMGESQPPNKIRKGLYVTDSAMGDKKLYIARSKKKTGSRKVLYIHGGGFVLESQGLQWNFVKEMANRTGVEVYYPQYPITPENTCIDALNMIVEVYRLILEKTDAKNIVIMGDSAGGGISLAVAMYIRELGLPQPGDIILISPGVLMECPKTSEDKAYMAILEKRDKMISSDSFDTICDLWRGKLNVTDYRVNPLYGDLNGLGKITVFVGTGEVIYLSVRKLRDKAKEQNVEIDYYEKENMMHCWVLIPFKESKRERDIIMNILKKHVKFQNRTY